MNVDMVSRADTAPGPASRWRWLRRRVLARLACIREGHLVVLEDGTRTSVGDPEAPAGLSATITVHDPRLWRALAFDGSLGAGTGYVNRLWSADDLTAALRVILRNRAVLSGLDRGLARLLAPFHRAAQALRRNTRGGARRNIEAHYDLGNDLFVRMLDPTLMYSCAFFERADMTLEEAQLAKLRRLCAKLDLRPDHHVLEIGSGWGGLACFVAEHHGCRVTTTTISAEQYAFALERVRAAGLSDRVTVLKQDYRDLEGRFDRVVSVEMIEAVGHARFDEYFRQCALLLKPDGLMVLQAITITDQRYEAARRSPDFIQRYIFPGSTIPSITALLRSVTRASDLRLTHLEDIGPHYATTLARWRGNFTRHWPQLHRLGYPERFARLWEYYLCYCEAGFAERALSDVQLLLAKPGYAGAPFLGNASR